jgi:hypothetical protein
MMRLSQKQRWLALGAALAATLVAVLLVDAVDEGGDNAVPVAAVSRSPRPAAATAAPGRLSLEALQRRRGGQTAAEIADVFPAQSWYVPPPEAPPVRTPPPLPFAYLATVREAGGITVFLTAQNRNFPIKPGELIDGSYRVEAVDDRRVVFTYLPMGMKQTLVIGGVAND